VTARASALAEALSTHAPEELRWVRAPGRVNLIGDHTDYNDGFVLPLAIDRDCLVAFAGREDGRVRVRSLDVSDGAGVVDLDASGGDDLAGVEPVWGRFVAGAIGAVGALAGHERAPAGMDAALSSTVPLGSGLSSSSALSVALTLALATAAGLRLDATAAARVALEAEVRATGVPGGLMDQLTAMFGQRGHALLIDCRALDVEPIPLPDPYAVLVVDSGVPRTLAGSAYGERRRACEAVAARLGLAALRDATLEQVRDEPLARHVVSENRRVLEFAEALRAGNFERLGPLLLESHASLRDDYEVSTPELDLAVELLVEHGAIGARLTGAGFGGCVVALVERSRAADAAAKTVARYGAETGLDAAAFVVDAVDGAGPVEPPPAT
jgi:galactokinase